MSIARLLLPAFSAVALLPGCGDTSTLVSTIAQELNKIQSAQTATTTGTSAVAPDGTTTQDAVIAQPGARGKQGGQQAQATGTDDQGFMVGDQPYMRGGQQQGPRQGPAMGFDGGQPEEGTQGDYGQQPQRGGRR